tara:strand:+ start:39238 stop:45405 length:6168 start_codon:yes stop_codon:yes gene_type:complete
MGLLDKNLNFIWFGDSCKETCEEYSFYSGSNLRSGFENVISVSQIKNAGFVFSNWSRETDVANREAYTLLPDIIKNNLSEAIFVKDSQGFEKFECGKSYIVKLNEGTQLDIPGAVVVNLGTQSSRRLENPCPTCPGPEDCGCEKIDLIFLNLDVNNKVFEGWTEQLTACMDFAQGTNMELYMSTTSVDVGTKLYIEERQYQDDGFSVSNQWVVANGFLYRIDDRTIVEIVNCEDIIPTPTPTPEFEVPSESVCVTDSTFDKYDGEYLHTGTRHNNRPVWGPNPSGAYFYYEIPVGMSEFRWMLSIAVGSKLGQIAEPGDITAYPYDVSWDGDDNYTHVITTEECPTPTPTPTPTPFITKTFYVDVCATKQKGDYTAVGDAVSVNGRPIYFDFREHRSTDRWDTYSDYLVSIGNTHTPIVLDADVVIETSDTFDALGVEVSMQYEPDSDLLYLAFDDRIAYYYDKDEPGVSEDYCDDFTSTMPIPGFMIWPLLCGTGEFMHPVHNEHLCFEQPSGLYLYYGNGTNSNGTFGEPRESPGVIKKELFHQDYPDNPVTKIVCHMYTAYFLKKDGSILASGWNTNGQLGMGVKKVRYEKFTRMITGNVRDICVSDGNPGEHFMCILDNDSLWGVGANQKGQLGIGNRDDQYTLVEIETDVKYGALGRYSTAIIKNDNSLWTTGTGPSLNSSQFVKLADDVKDVSCGFNFIMFVKTDGSLWGMGDNTWGVLGGAGVDGTGQAIESASVPVQILDSGVKSVHCGSNHAYIVKDDSSAWAIGNNEFGQLGDGTTTTRKSFVRVVKSGISKVEAGTHGALMLTDVSELIAIGNDNYGQLSHGVGKSILWPTIVETQVEMVSLGDIYSLYIKNEDLPLPTSECTELSFCVSGVSGAYAEYNGTYVPGGTDLDGMDYWQQTEDLHGLTVSRPRFIREKSQEFNHGGDVHYQHNYVFTSRLPTTELDYFIAISEPPITHPRECPHEFEWKSFGIGQEYFSNMTISSEICPPPTPTRFVFRKIDFVEKEYLGWDEDSLHIACRDAEEDLKVDHLVLYRVYDSPLDVGTELFMSVENRFYDDFAVNNEWIYTSGALFRLNGGVIVEVRDCDDVPTPTPEPIIPPWCGDPPEKDTYICVQGSGETAGSFDRPVDGRYYYSLQSSSDKTEWQSRNSLIYITFMSKTDDRNDLGIDIWAFYAESGDKSGILYYTTEFDPDSYCPPYELVNWTPTGRMSSKFVTIYGFNNCGDADVDRIPCDVLDASHAGWFNIPSCKNTLNVSQTSSQASNSDCNINYKKYGDEFAVVVNRGSGTPDQVEVIKQSSYGNFGVNPGVITPPGVGWYDYPGELPNACGSYEHIIEIPFTQSIDLVKLKMTTQQDIPFEYEVQGFSTQNQTWVKLKRLGYDGLVCGDVTFPWDTSTYMRHDIIRCLYLQMMGRHASQSDLGFWGKYHYTLETLVERWINHPQKEWKNSGRPDPRYPPVTTTGPDGKSYVVTEFRNGNYNSSKPPLDGSDVFASGISGIRLYVGNWNYNTHRGTPRQSLTSADAGGRSLVLHSIRVEGRDAEDCLPDNVTQIAAADYKTITSPGRRVLTAPTLYPSSVVIVGERCIGTRLHGNYRYDGDVQDILYEWKVNGVVRSTYRYLDTDTLSHGDLVEFYVTFKYMETKSTTYSTNIKIERCKTLLPRPHDTSGTFVYLKRTSNSDGIPVYEGWSEYSVCDNVNAPWQVQMWWTGALRQGSKLSLERAYQTHEEIHGSNRWFYHKETRRVVELNTDKIVVSMFQCPPQDITFSGTSIQEGSGYGKQVGGLMSTPYNSNVVYSLVSGSGSTNNQNFILTGKNTQLNLHNFNVITSSQEISYDSTKSLKFRVRATIANSHQYTEKQFSVNVTPKPPEYFSCHNIRISGFVQNPILNGVYGLTAKTDIYGKFTGYDMVNGKYSYRTKEVNGQWVKLSWSSWKGRWELWIKSQPSVRSGLTPRASAADMLLLMNRYNIMPRTTNPTGIFFNNNTVVASPAAHSLTGHGHKSCPFPFQGVVFYCTSCKYDSVAAAEADRGVVTDLGRFVVGRDYRNL